MQTSGCNGVGSYGRGAIVAAAVVLGSGSAMGQNPPYVDLSAVVRDFSKTHPDFNRIPLLGYGNYAGNVALDLDDEGKPVYTGEGFKIWSTWRNANNQAIAPHLYNTCGIFFDEPDQGDQGLTSYRLTVDQRVTVEDRSTIDSFDSNLGPYGEGNADAHAMMMVNGTDRDGAYVKVKGKSSVKGDVLVNPNDDPAKVVKVEKSSEITGTVGNMETVAEIADAEMPEMALEKTAGHLKYKGGEHAITESIHCRDLSMKRRAVVTVTGDVTIWCDETMRLDDESVLQIEGNVTIRCDRELSLDDRSEIRLGEGATLTVLASRRIEMEDRSMLNMNTGDPQRVMVSMMSVTSGGNSRSHRKDDKSAFELDDRSMACAWVQGADAHLEIDDASEFFGSFKGWKVTVEDRSRLHVDMATAAPPKPVVVIPEECDLGDIAGVVQAPSGGDVTSAGTFAEWWRDVLGVNLSTVQTMRLVPDAAGVYGYLNSNYRPIEGLLLGNEGLAHNYHFTAELDATFTYTESAGQWIEFRGTDDTYIFINGKLVIDMGGYGPNKVQFVDLARLGLDDGDACRFQLFHAQREQGLAIFRLRTNIVLADNATSPPINSVLED